MALADIDRRFRPETPASPVLDRIRRASLTVVIVAAVIGAVEVATRLFDVPAYLFPAPSRVAAAFAAQPAYLLAHAGVTALEIGLGLVFGILAGIATALVMASAPALERAFKPVLIVTQALPVFAIAPLLVIWFGYGLASKVVMAGLIIYFPVAAAFYDGLTRTDPGLLDLARLARVSRATTLRLIRVPAALPYLVTGIRVAATVAPIGAIVGEWVGASAGLGFVMLHANARMQTDMLFAALTLLAILALSLRFSVDLMLARLVPWCSDTRP